MQTLIFVIVTVVVIAYIVFFTRTYKMYKVIELVMTRQKETVVINLTFEQIENVILAQTRLKNTIVTKTSAAIYPSTECIIFEYKETKLKILSIADNKVLLTLA